MSLVVFVSTVVWQAWFWCAMFTSPWGRGWVPVKSRMLARLVQELRPLYLPALLIWKAHDISASHQSWLDWLGTALCVWVWFDIKGDDRWKRRRRKVAERVKVLGSRLVVVPARTQ